MNYTVTLNPEACHEVHLGRFSVPAGSHGLMDEVHTGPCRPAARSASETVLYLTVACVAARHTWVSPPPKYAVDLSGREGTRRISDAEWGAATELSYSGFATKGVTPRDEDSGVQCKGPLLKRSGPRWHGVGGDPMKALLSWSANRVAVNSWDGVIEYGEPFGFVHGPVRGQYWIDIYETGTGRPLVRIQGSFRGANPYIFQMHGAGWYGDRYYILPVGREMGNGEFSMRRLLVCDVDAASRKGETVLKERK